ncbi:uncharacterized protein LOC143832931 [Paroedura picta]|uniref:uncharacterized protein LOC143832931 n=1 Tax=Paroedura picta TaxID=143630 RepID=UPI0040569436
MLGSRMCWQLLLGWALLLGQPAFGDSDATEEPSEDSLPEELGSAEQTEDLVVPELGEVPEPGNQESPTLTSDENLENEEKEGREFLKEDLTRPWNFEINYLQRAVLEYHHEHNPEHYITFENANLIAQKAIGTMIYLRMPMVKTNCTNDLRPKKGESDHAYYYRLYRADRYPRNCEPLSDSEKENCKFTFFEDARNPGKPVIVNLRCYESFEEDLDYFRDGLRM